MSLFLGPGWLAVMREVGAVSGVRSLELGQRTLHVGEVRSFRQAKWVLYGSPEEGAAELLPRLLDRARREGVWLVESAFNMSRWGDRALLERHGATITRTFGTYRVDLGRPEGELLAAFHQNHRNMVRRAQREGVRVAFHLDLGEFHAQLDSTYARDRREHRFTLRYLEALARHLGEGVLLAGAYRGERLEAAAIVPWDREAGWFLHGASREWRTPGAATLLQWEVMRRLQGLGVARYDLGGALADSEDGRLAGIYRFKRRFGGTFLPCWYWECRGALFPYWWHRSLEWAEGRGVRVR